MRRFRPARPVIAWFLAALIVAVAASPQVRALHRFPSDLRIMEGDVRELDLPYPLVLSVRANQQGLLQLNGIPLGTSFVTARPGERMSVSPAGPGTATVDIRLFGVVPFRRVAVHVLPRVEVHPGGHSIGIVLHPEGVLVVGHAPVAGEGGPVSSPARDAGVLVGDVILRVDGVAVGSEDDLLRLVERAGAEGRPAGLEVRRGGALLRLEVTPRYSPREGRHLLGLWIRDTTLGVGTLTFYDEATGRYGALGHVVTDGDTQQPVRLEGGRIVKASVSQVEQGRRGVPGEKLGAFRDDRDVIGTIDDNSPFGIYGILSVLPEPGVYRGPVPISLQHDIRPGPAEILTVISGHRVERFAIEIVSLAPQNSPAGKSMVVRVTDPRLLEHSGGIVQGMSGSPILQGGRLVGAVTHVFVNDPTRGYAVYIEWMVLQSGLLDVPLSALARPPAA